MENNNITEKKGRMLQADMPRSTLSEVVALAETLRDNFAGTGASGIDLATAFSRSPASSSWRMLTGAAVAYGVTDGAYNAQTISLTPLGWKIVQPQEEGEDRVSLVTAACRPSILNSFYKKFDGARLPNDQIAKNILKGFGVPPDRADEAFKIAVANAEYIGVLTRNGDNLFLQLRNAGAPRQTVSVSAPIPPTSSISNIGNAAPKGSVVPGGLEYVRETVTHEGMESVSIADGGFILYMPSALKDKILDSDDEQLENAWKAARSALRTLYDFHKPKPQPLDESRSPSADAEDDEGE